eukprot:CAMPEP_0194416176 /NCGR_PEP_ID=MMETSP0176-20130528/15107_1 /TAXON_ID=216777 /ORGANISM="Proboscia alata, Strain PI-D3" /LENGTH=250 /DNA_ID=CAMNT_0039221331 /DNA_START=48 /DNA_END=797 /DNA_ORIENTATION=+
METLQEEFRRQGFVKIPPSTFSLDTDTITSLRQEFSNLFAGDYSTGIYPDEIHWRHGISHEHSTREICNGWKASHIVQTVVGSEELGRIACGLMGWEASRIGQDDVLHKPPHSNPVGFHQDGTYISDNFCPRDDNCLTMWIALDDADEGNGALQYAPGSHSWQNESKNDVSASSFHVGDEQDHFTSLREAARRAGRDEAEVVSSVQTVPVKVGEMVVHHQSVWHGSGSNASSTRIRRALVIHLIDGEVTW